MSILEKRARQLNEVEIKSGPVVYWLSRDQRTKDNWALLAAQELALSRKAPVIVVFTLANSFLGATYRQYSFMLDGLKELEESLASKNIPFVILVGDPVELVAKFIKREKVGTLINDFSPLKISRTWKRQVASKVGCAFFEVDAHNIVPVWLASPKQEFGAYTIRPKIKKLLPEFLISFPSLKKHPYSINLKINNEYKKIIKALNIDYGVGKVDAFLSGEKEAHKAMKKFLEKRLVGYNLNRNNPVINAQSKLSPYLHFGQLSAQALALEVQKAKSPPEDREAFLEELIIRRELADNFCLYNQNYDHPEAFPDWAKKSIKKHAGDRREYLYNLKELELAKTHDNLWNAAQQEMLKTGKMHGYMRMYWAKKILEWTSDVETAMEIAIYLNDKYELDGRDPNGYAGIAWSIGGIHDRAWFERPIFGQIRYMNENGCRRKFKVDEYIKLWL
jgi:deoxyribodipyrimidine photo-lyase